ncbi:DUF4349 domain-containing protein [Glacieibacterium frigidum]|uniref:DUF4349 domain-containing protein n=1 Tax=Glacieibacterium frigidum TaxID=2593303 RepID=A0A552U885_9SPHN|nr:DUF4349 domain-containing protein [Glacieibacterium frigidum]TRW14389.1 DUF4349 domain-containing protein [Glacieibacterium frigidum]
MRTAWLASLIVLGVAGCGERGSQTEADSAAVMSEAAPAPTAGGAPAARASAADAAPASVALPQIAYDYDFTLELPAAAVVPLFERHRRACEAAGPARCQIVGAGTETVGGTDTSATLELRAETGWLAAFRGRLAGDAGAAKGRIAASSTTSEDLGRTISDSAARLRALTTLQGRLETLLATRNGKLADLLEIERELARVGGEIDATRSALADMRGRVSLPKATIVYRPDSLAVAGANAGGGLPGSLFAVASQSLFLLLNLLAAVLPWAVLLAVPVWLLVRARRARKRRVDETPPLP